MEKLILGIDGGGTKTRALLCRGDGTVVGFGEAGGFNLNNLPHATCVANVRKALGEAFGGSTFPEPDAAFVGACTIKDEADERAVAGVLHDAGLRTPRLGIANDLVNVLASGIPEGEGIALIAGTGSHVVARDRDGRMTCCGGWGYLIGDAGSGYFLGIEAIKAVALACDGRGSATGLTEPVLKALRIDHPLALLRAVCDHVLGAHGIAALAPLVITAAEGGDHVACGILREATEGLAECVATAARQAGLGGNIPVVFAGGVACSGSPYQPMLEEAIQARLPGARFVGLQLPLECGAATLALRAAGLPVTPEILTRLKTTHPLHR
jgi:N-acetylglucosamine kinase-like BadF-type ATPase